MQSMRVEEQNQVSIAQQQESAKKLQQKLLETSQRLSSTMKENNLNAAQYEQKIIALQIEKKQVEVKLEDVTNALSLENQKLLGKIAQLQDDNGELEQRS